MHRLNKFLALCGLASRRKCEDIIQQGRVLINGVLADHPYTRVQDSDVVTVDGAQVSIQQRKVYIVLYKPQHCISAMKDNSDGDRSVIADFMDGIGQRVYNVGRLDYKSEGLMFLTNDGELACLIPRSQMRQVFEFKVCPALDESAERILIKTLPCEKTGPSWYVASINSTETDRLYKCVSRLGCYVVRSKRTAVGPLRLGQLMPGHRRELTNQEVDSLRDAVIATMAPA